MTANERGSFESVAPVHIVRIAEMIGDMLTYFAGLCRV